MIASVRTVSAGTVSASISERNIAPRLARGSIDTQTGLRQGEAFGVTVDRVDFLRRTLTVDRQITQIGRTVDFGPPKTKTIGLDNSAGRSNRGTACGAYRRVRDR